MGHINAVADHDWPAGLEFDTRDTNKCTLRLTNYTSDLFLFNVLIHSYIVLILLVFVQRCNISKNNLNHFNYLTTLLCDRRSDHVSKFVACARDFYTAGTVLHLCTDCGLRNKT